MHVSLKVYANIWMTTSEFNKHSHLQSKQSIIVPSPDVDFLKDNTLCLCSLLLLLIDLVKIGEGFSHNCCRILTLYAPIAAKVVCFFSSAECLRNLLDPDQTAPVLGPRCLLLYLIHQ